MSDWDFSYWNLLWFFHCPHSGLVTRYWIRKHWFHLECPVKFFWWSHFEFANLYRHQCIYKLECLALSLPATPSKLPLFIDEIYLSWLLNDKHCFPRNKICLTLNFRYVLVSTSCYEWAGNNLIVTVSPGNQYSLPLAQFQWFQMHFMSSVFSEFLQKFFFFPKQKVLVPWEWFSSAGVFCWQNIGMSSEKNIIHFLPLKVPTPGILKSSRFALYWQS